MSFLPFLVINLLLASFAAHFAFRFFDSGERRRITLPTRRAGRGRDAR